MIIEVRTRKPPQMVDITSEVTAAIDGRDDGFCHVYVPHTTAAVVINESADPDVARDLIAAYEAMPPDLVRARRGQFRCPPPLNPVWEAR